MIPVLSKQNMRLSDADTIARGTTGAQLMARAAEGVVRSVSWQAPVGIVCGGGNNGGDGYCIALLLQKRGIACEIIVVGDKFSPDGLYYFQQCRQHNIPIHHWQGALSSTNYRTVVDCLFGTGFGGEVRGAARDVIQYINQSGAYVVSVDINSGLDSDNGLGDLCVLSDLTVAIGGYKAGHFLGRAKDVMKQKTTIDIGIRPLEAPYWLIEADDVRPVFAKRPNFCHKGTYGYTALIGGSLAYSGAIRLAYMANAAMRAGAGVVKVALPRTVAPIAATHILESTLFPLDDIEGQIVFDKAQAAQLIGNVKTVAFGMGVGTAHGTAQWLRYLLDHYNGVLIVDADGLSALADLPTDVIHQTACRLVVTPHAKEMARLTGLSVADVLAQTVQTALGYARQTSAVVLLKGPTTVVTDGQTVYLVDAGCAGMATAGSGDVLSGILAAITAYCPDLPAAVAAGAYINGKAGEAAQLEMGDIGMVASDTARHIAKAIADLQSNHQS